jgi:4-hydroxyphenylpyruvate dioxygenase
MVIKSIFHVEFCVGNSYQASHFYRTVMGLSPVAYSGPETGVKDRASYLLQRGAIRFLLSSPVTTSSELNRHLERHGEGICDIAFEVDDARSAFEECVSSGARAVREPWKIEDASGKAVLARIGAFGDTVHTFVERDAFKGAFLPAYRPLERMQAADTGFERIDHFAVSVDQGTAESWVTHYDRVFGFRTSREEDIATEYSAMFSKVTESKDRGAVFVFVEPAEGRRASPITEYLRYYGGAGVHHMALSTTDIVGSVRTLRGQGVRFTQTPRTYYDALPARVGQIAQSLNDLSEFGILVDRDTDGYLMQIFTQPVQSRPTLSFEVIQREGALGFGSGNIKALFEAIERAQLERGNA